LVAGVIVVSFLPVIIELMRDYERRQTIWRKLAYWRRKWLRF